MTPITSNIVAGSSLSISVTGTAYLQRSAAAGVLPGVLARKTDELAIGGETGAHALSKASAATIEAIERAVKNFSPNPSLSKYKDGTGFYNEAGMYLNIIA